MVASGLVVGKRLVTFAFLVAALLGALLLDNSASGAPPSSGCDSGYTKDYFHVCFFELDRVPSGADRNFGTYLGSENEPVVAQGTDRTLAMPISRQWSHYRYNWLDVIFNPACSDGMTNGDNDTLVDGADPECQSLAGGQSLAEGPTGSTECFDFNDNDGDGKTDNRDPGCFTPPPDEGRLSCSDNIDNDNDGVKDGLDTNCAWPSEGPQFHATCYDGDDNEQPPDGFVDYDGYKRDGTKSDPNQDGWPDPDTSCADPPPNELLTGGLGPGRFDDMAGSWRGRFHFNPGRYQFSVFADDGVRVFIDEQRVLNEWTDSGGYPRDYVVIRDLTRGYHNIRVEWYDSGFIAQLRLHWDKVPTIANARTSQAIVNVFIINHQDVCIVGNVYSGTGQSLDIKDNMGTPENAWDDTIPHQWQVDAQLRVLPESDPGWTAGEKRVCFSFGFSPNELNTLKTQLADFEAKVESWSGGALDLVLPADPTQLEGEITLTVDGGTMWLSSKDIAARAKPFMHRATDFVLGFNSVQDLNSTLYHINPTCGRGFGSGRVQGGMWGAPYAWVASPCATSDVIANEWEHQFSAVIGKDPGATSLLGFRPIYPNLSDYPVSNFPVWPHSVDGRGFPPCGEGLRDQNGQVDTFRWFVDHYASPYEPASPWCGWLQKNPDWPIKEPTVPGIATQVATNTLWHFDSSLAHYPLGYFTGNHCDDGKKDFDETGVDSGTGSCPGAAPEVSVTSPTNGSVVSGIYQVNAESYDAAYVEIYIDGQLVKTDSFPPYDYTWDTTQYPECSSHTVSARAFDWSGMSASTFATVKASNTSPNLDTDGDGFNDGSERYMGTDPCRSCPATATADDESLDAWPPDFNDDRTVDQIGDQARMNQHMFTARGDPAYDPRFDLNADGRIDMIGDQTILNSWMFTSCS